MRGSRAVSWAPRQAHPVWLHGWRAFITDREGGLRWGSPSEEQFRFTLAHVGERGGYLCGRRLYETVLPWETDPALRDNALRDAFADVWSALAEVVLSRTLDSVQGNARLARASLARRFCNRTVVALAAAGARAGGVSPADAS